VGQTGKRIRRKHTSTLVARSEMLMRSVASERSVAADSGRGRGKGAIMLLHWALAAICVGGIE
jgi:cytochrome c biogenesis protein ResB